MIVYNIEDKKFDNQFIDQFNNEQRNLIIPFSSLFKKKSLEDIYSGNEKIPFKERHPTYKAILKLEFEDAIKTWIYSNS